MYDDQHYVERYSSSMACAAAGITQGQLKNWVSRQPAAIVLWDKEREPDSTGRVRFVFSFARVMHLAITASLVRLGIDPRQAATVAEAFRTGSGGQLPGDYLNHQPGEIFQEGLTLLLAWPAELHGEVIKAPLGASYREILGASLKSHSENPEGVVILDLGSLYRRVSTALEACSVAGA